MSWADTFQCSGCPAREPCDDAAKLPEGWDAFFRPGQGWRPFCPACVKDGGMEVARCAVVAPHRKRWAYPDAVLAMFKPATHSVLLATPDGMAELAERDAEALHKALAGALATRDLAKGLAG